MHKQFGSPKERCYNRAQKPFLCIGGTSCAEMPSKRGAWNVACPAQTVTDEDHSREDYRMRRLMRPARLVAAGRGCTLPALADKAKDLYLKGQDAEARQNYEAAFDFFKQAYDLKPKDLRYRSAFERIRFEAAATWFTAGRCCATTASSKKRWRSSESPEIDPSLFIAKQELTRTLKMIKDKTNPPPQAAGPPSGLERKVREARWAGRTGSYLERSHHVKLTDKSDIVYRTIGQLAGINVLFDPDYTPSAIKVELNGVTLEEALEITALESKTFWRPVTQHDFCRARQSGKAQGAGTKRP